MTVSILVITIGISISQLVTHRYNTSLIEGAVAQAENIAHNLALDAVDKILINDLVALQKLLDDQMRSNPSVAYLFVIKDERILTHTFSEGVPVRLIKANHTSPPFDTEHGHLDKGFLVAGRFFELLFHLGDDLVELPLADQHGPAQASSFFEVGFSLECPIEIRQGRLRFVHFVVKAGPQEQHDRIIGLHGKRLIQIVHGGF